MFTQTKFSNATTHTAVARLRLGTKFVRMLGPDSMLAWEMDVARVHSNAAPMTGLQFARSHNRKGVLLMRLHGCVGEAAACTCRGTRRALFGLHSCKTSLPLRLRTKPPVKSQISSRQASVGLQANFLVHFRSVLSNSRRSCGLRCVCGEGHVVAR